MGSLTPPCQVWCPLGYSETFSSRGPAVLDTVCAPRGKAKRFHGVGQMSVPFDGRLLAVAPPKSSHSNLHRMGRPNSTHPIIWGPVLGRILKMSGPGVATEQMGPFYPRGMVPLFFFLAGAFGFYGFQMSRTS